MRLIKQSLDRDSMGSITLFPEDPEDMWHAYNLLHPTDLLRASALRKVTTESATGSTTTHRVHTTLTIAIEKIDFDPPSASLHINGRVCVENPYVKLGAYHTLDLELNRNFTVTKTHGWDSVSLGVVRDACDPTEKAEIGAVVMHEGVANICLVTDYMTVLRQRIEVPIPRKRRGLPATGHDKGVEKFYQLVYQGMLRNLNIEALKVVLIASPGFLAEGLMGYIFTEAAKAESGGGGGGGGSSSSTNGGGGGSGGGGGGGGGGGNSLTGTTTPFSLLKQKSKFLTAHTSSGHIHSLNELLKTPEVQSRLSNTRFLHEAKAMDTFFDMMTTDEDRAWYGPSEVEKAVEKGAVKTLLISNTLFRSQSIAERRKYVRLVEEVKEMGGEALVLSSIHESGRRLDGLGGVAAVLNFPLVGLDEEEEAEAEAAAEAAAGEAAGEQDTGNAGGVWEEGGREQDLR